MENLSEPCFGFDNFGEPLVHKGSQVLIDTILTVLFGRPGFYPSIPELGMYIQQYRYNLFQGINLEEFRSKLSYQCNLLDDAINENMMDVALQYMDTAKRVPILLISINLVGNSNKKLLIGVKTDGDAILYNHMLYEDDVLN